MKARLIRRYGAPEVFEAGELPAALGVDLAGDVVELGAGVRRFKKADRVLAFTGLQRAGGYGEFAVVPESFGARIPSTLSWAEAGTVPGVGATAWEAFTVHAPVKPGMRVFINGGAGGVGTYAIQIAKALGAEVTATCSEAKSALVRDPGSTNVIDYTRGDPFATGHDSYDVVLNCVRGPSLAPMRKLLKAGGVLVTVTGNPLEAAVAKVRNLVSSRRTVAFFVMTSGELLEGLAALIEAGKVRPVVERTYAWSELAEAHRRVETGRVAGKLAVVPEHMESTS